MILPDKFQIEIEHDNPPHGNYKCKGVSGHCIPAPPTSERNAESAIARFLLNVDRAMRDELRDRIDGKAVRDERAYQDRKLAEKLRAQEQLYEKMYGRKMGTRDPDAADPDDGKLKADPRDEHYKRIDDFVGTMKGGQELYRPPSNTPEGMALIDAEARTALSRPPSHSMANQQSAFVTCPPAFAPDMSNSKEAKSPEPPVTESNPE